MSIAVQCETCGKRYSVGDHLAGKRGKCRHCGGVFVVPFPPVAPVDSDARASDEPDLDGLSVADEMGAVGSVEQPEAVVSVSGRASDAEATPVDPVGAMTGDFPARPEPSALGAIDPVLAKVLIVLALGLPAALVVRDALTREKPWLTLSGLLVFLLLCWMLVLPVSWIGMTAALRNLRVGAGARARLKLMGAIALPLGGVMVGHVMGGPRGALFGAVLGLFPGAVALAYQFRLGLAETIMAVGAVAVAWTGATAGAVAFGYGVGFAVNVAVEAVQKNALSDTIATPTLSPPTTQAVVPVPADLGVAPSNSVVAPSNSVVAPSNSVVAPSNSVVEPSNSVVEPPNSVVEPSNSVVAPSNAVVRPSNSVVEPSNSVVAPSNAVVAPPNPAPQPVEPSARERSASNLTRIGEALLVDAKAHDGLLAPDLATLASRTGLSAGVLDSPVGRASTGADYRYLLSDVTIKFPLDADLVVAYDIADAEHGEGAMILRGDRTVRFVDASTLKELLRRTREALPPPGELLPGAGVTVGAPAKPNGAAAVEVKGVAPVESPAPDSIDATVARPVEGRQVNQRPIRDVRAPVREDQVQRPPFVTNWKLLGVEGTADAAVVPTPPGVWVAMVRPQTTDEDVVERFNMQTGESGGGVRFTREATVSYRYALAPGGDALVRLVNWPRLGLQVWGFEGGKVTRTIDLDPALGTPELVGFVTPALVAVMWDRNGVRGLELWDVRTGARGRQSPLPPFTPDAVNGVLIGDGKTFAVVTPIDGRNHFELIDTLGLRGVRRVPITSVDPRWPLKIGGIALSPDGTKLAALFERERDALLVVSRLSDGRVMSEVPCPPGVVPQTGRMMNGGALTWLGESGPWLTYGRFVIDATGAEVGDIGAGDFIAQKLIDARTLALVRQGYGDDGTQVVRVVIEPTKMMRQP